MSDLIDRQAAIDILDAYQVMVENGEENPYAWARLRMSELPPAQPIDVQEAYYRGKIDGIKECMARMKKINEEFANGRLNQQAGGD